MEAMETPEKQKSSGKRLKHTVTEDKDPEPKAPWSAHKLNFKEWPLDKVSR